MDILRQIGSPFADSVDPTSARGSRTCRLNNREAFSPDRRFKDLFDLRMTSTEWVRMSTIVYGSRASSELVHAREVNQFNDRLTGVADDGIRQGRDRRMEPLIAFAALIALSLLAVRFGRDTTNCVASEEEIFSRRGFSWASSDETHLQVAGADAERGPLAERFEYRAR